MLHVTIVAADPSSASAGGVYSVDVKSYGAIGDGVADDTDAITAAFTRAQTLQLPLYFPPGVYGYTGTRVFTSSGIAHLIGVPGASTLKMLSSTTGTRIQFFAPEVRLNGLIFDANSGIELSGWGVVLESTVLSCVITDCEFKNAYGSLGYGLYVAGNGTDTENVFTDGYYLIKNCSFHHNARSGVWVTNADRVIIDGCRAFSNTANGIRVDTQDVNLARTNQRTIIQNNLCWSNANGINVGNINRDNTTAPPVYWDFGFADARHILLSDNVCWQNSGYGINVNNDFVEVANCISEKNQYAAMLFLCRDSSVNGGCYDGSTYSNAWTIDCGVTLRCSFTGVRINGGQTGLSAGVSGSISVQGCIFTKQTIAGIGFTSVETDGVGVAFQTIGRDAAIRDNTFVLSDNTVMGIAVKDGYRGAEISSNKFLTDGTATLDPAIYNAVFMNSDEAIVRDNSINGSTYYTRNLSGSGNIDVPDMIDRIHLTSQGYVTGPIITIRPHSFSLFTQKVAFIRVTHKGVGGATPFTGTLPTTVTFTGGGGTAAAATPYFDQDGYLLGGRMSNLGSGYTSLPTAVIGGTGGTNCTITPVLGGSVITNRDVEVWTLNPIALVPSGAPSISMGTVTSRRLPAGGILKLTSRFNLWYLTFITPLSGTTYSAWTSNTHQMSAAAINAGGSGYTVGDVLTLAGFTGTAPTLRVLVVSAGVITSVALITTGDPTVVPSNPVSCTGGTGTSATFNLTFVANSIIISESVLELHLVPAGTITAGTIIMPIGAPDAQEITISSTQAITTLTVLGNTGQTVNGAPVTLAANGFFVMRYRDTSLTWRRVG